MNFNETNLTATSVPFPKEQWYVAAFSREVTRTPLQRRCLGLPIVLYRTEAGKPVALFDRCPHRGMPLSMGKCVGDRLQCVYHGMEFGSDGVCAHVPTGGPIPSTMRVDAFPVVERWDWIWIWTGAPERADPALIPDHDELKLTAADYKSEAGIVIDTDCNFLVAVENLSDLSHLPFLHGAPPAFHEPTISTTDKRVDIARRLKGDLFPDWMVSLLGIQLGHVSGGVTQTVYMPGVVVVAATFEDLDKADKPVIDNRWVVAFTPVEHGKTRIFFSLAVNYEAHLPGFWEDLRKTMAGDYGPIEEIQRLDDSLPPGMTRDVSVKVDGGLVHMRRTLGKMLASEAADKAGAIPERPSTKIIEPQRTTA